MFPGVITASVAVGNLQLLRGKTIAVTFTPKQKAMNGQADEFCLVEPLASTEVVDLLQKPGSSQGSNGTVFGEEGRLLFYYRLFCFVLFF